jgi:GNAT superfamily N-acetyltransferase
MDDSSSREPDTAPAVRVRPALAEDVPGIWRVHNDSIRELCGERYGPEEIAAWIAFRSPDAYLQALASRALFVAEWQGAIVGFGQLDPARAEIEACYVAPEAVGSGIGSALLARMEDEARDRGHRIVRLNATLNAEKFYARKGYRWLGRATHRVSADVDLPCVRMEKALPPEETE